MGSRACPSSAVLQWICSSRCSQCPSSGRRAPVQAAPAPCDASSPSRGVLFGLRLASLSHPALQGVLGSSAHLGCFCPRLQTRRPLSGPWPRLWGGPCRLLSRRRWPRPGPLQLAGQGDMGVDTLSKADRGFAPMPPAPTLPVGPPSPLPLLLCAPPAPQRGARPPPFTSIHFCPVPVNLHDGTGIANAQPRGKRHHHLEHGTVPCD